MRLSLLLGCFLYGISAHAGRAILTGHIADTSVHTVTLQYYDTYLDFIESKHTSHQAALDAKRDFKFVVEIKHPLSFNLMGGDNWFTINKYLAPGDSVSLQFNDNSTTIDGRCENCIGFIYELEARFIEDPRRRATRESSSRLSPIAFAGYTDSNRLEQLTFLNEFIKDKPVPPEFIVFMTTQINYQSAGDLLRYTWGHSGAMRDPEYISYLLRIAPMGGTLNSGRYVNYLRELPYSSWRAQVVRDNAIGWEENRKRYPASDYSYTQELHVRDSIAKKYFTGPAYDIALYQILYDQFGSLKSAKGTNKYDTVYKLVEERLQQFAHSFNDRYFYHRLEEKLSSIKNTRPAPDFTVKTLDGKEVKLSDYKGKVLYVDFWATNCAPCVAELPHLKKLEALFEGKDVVFLCVSMGDRKEILAPFLKARNISGLQSVEPKGLGSSLAHDYQISALPRYIVIDRKGVLVNDDAPRPSAHPESLIEETLGGQ